MAQSGMPVPADRAELPVFDAVLADIGDYQSIEQNLSTFSAHVTNIDFISRTATPRITGAARRTWICHRSRRGRGPGGSHRRPLSAASACMTIISTHHTSLKVYAANTPGVLNAAVGFDERTLQPTYEIQGRSARRFCRNQHRPASGTESVNHRERARSPWHPGS